MENSKELDTFANALVKKAVLSNAIPAMVAMLMVLIYNLADTFFIGLTRDDMQVAAVSLATPVFLLFMYDIINYFIFKIKKERVNQFLNSFTLYHIIILSKKEF